MAFTDLKDKNPQKWDLGKTVCQDWQKETGKNVKEGLSTRSVQKILGRYLIQKKIGQGGMGEVYKAFDPDLDRVVALKLIVRFFHSSQDRVVRRFEKEARALAKLFHPNIIKIYDFGYTQMENDGGKIPFFAMEYVEGEVLSKLAELQVTGGKIYKVVNLFIALAEALSYVHSCGVIHRDIKPDNILVDKDSVPKIMDFGLVKMLSESDNLTKSMEMMGTPQYVSPEQIMNTKSVDHRTDIYSLGASLYYVLSGCLPYDSVDPWTVIRMVSQEDPVPLNKLGIGIDKELSGICSKAMAKDLTVRYSSAKEFLSDLQRYAKGEVVEVFSLGLVYRLSKYCRKYKSELKLSLFFLIIIGFMFLGFVFFSIHQFSGYKNQIKLLENKHKIQTRILYDCIKSANGLVQNFAEQENDVESLRLFGKAMVFYGDYKYDKAVDSFSLVLSRHPNWMDVWVYRGICYIKQGCPDKALSDFNRAIVLDKQNGGKRSWMPYYVKGYVLMVSDNKHQEALQYFLQARALGCNRLDLELYIQKCSS